MFSRRQEALDLPGYVQEMQKRLAVCYAAARKALKASAKQQRRHHDTRLSQKLYSVGDAILKKAVRKVKFDVDWEGPYVVKKRINDVLYEVANKRKSMVTHHDRIKPYMGNLPKWAKKLKMTL